MSRLPDNLKSVYRYPHWRQRIPLSGTHSTPGSVGIDAWEEMGIDDSDVKDKSVLEVGASDGLLSFIAKQKGARKVMATDIWNSRGQISNYSGFPKKGFEIANSILGSPVSSKTCSILDLNDCIKDQFDIIICRNVLGYVGEVRASLDNMLAIASGSIFIKTEYASDLAILLDKYYDVKGFTTYSLKREQSKYESILIRKGTDIYEDYELSNKMISVKEGKEGVVLYTLDSSIFVKFGGFHRGQGWIDKRDAIEVSASGVTRYMNYIGCLSAKRIVRKINNKVSSIWEGKEMKSDNTIRIDVE